MIGPDFYDDVVETMREHELVAVDAYGSLCSCGETVPSWLEHLGDVALVAVGAEPPSKGRRQPPRAVSDTAAREALAQARAVLAEMQAWQEIVAEASRLHFDLATGPWPEIAMWHAKVPRYLEPEAARRWLRGQKSQATWRQKFQPTPRQLEIALASHPQPINLNDFIPRTARKELAS